MSQSQRERAMQGFRSRRFDILVATDIAARGIDVSGVSHVINYDVPNTPEAYTHRIGRTGRAEREGKACTFVTGEDSAWVRATERMIGTSIPRRQVDGFEGESLDSKTARGSDRTPAKRNGAGSRRRDGRRPSGRRGGSRQRAR
jgi:ATP-dependent RNA helicase RhlE